MDFVIITNNPYAGQKLDGRATVELLDAPFDDVLRRVRDLVHAGHRLLTHPLSGSVKPRETPYKSVMLSAKTGPVDPDSLVMIEDSIRICGAFSDRRQACGAGEDYQLVDFSLIQSAIESADRC